MYIIYLLAVVFCLFVCQVSSGNGRPSRACVGSLNPKSDTASSDEIKTTGFSVFKVLDAKAEALQVITQKSPFEIQNYIQALSDDVQTLRRAGEEQKRLLNGDRNVFHLKMVHHNLRLAHLNDKMANLIKTEPLARPVAEEFFDLTKTVPDTWILSISLAELILYHPALSRLKLDVRNRREILKKLLTQKALNAGFLSTEPHFWKQYSTDLQEWTSMRPSLTEFLQKVDMIIAAAFSHVPSNGLSENEIQFLVDIANLIPKRVDLKIPSKLFMSRKTFFPWHSAQLKRAEPLAYSKLRLVLGD